MTMLVALGAALIIAGAFTIVRGWQPAPMRGSQRALTGRLRRRWQAWSPALRLRAGIGVLLGVLVLAFTGFIPAVVLIPAGFLILPGLLRAPPQSDIDMLEALDRWVRLLAASVATGKSVAQALRATVAQAPARLSEPIRALLMRLDDRWPLRAGLQQLADELDSADADAVLAALILVGERGGVGASGTLRALSDSTQDRLRALREINTERAKPLIVVRQVTVITLAAIGGALVFAPHYFAPFGTPIGQLLMIVLAVGYLSSLAALRRMATPRRRERILVQLAG